MLIRKKQITNDYKFQKYKKCRLITILWLVLMSPDGKKNTTCHNLYHNILNNKANKLHKHIYPKASLRQKIKKKNKTEHMEINQSKKQNHPVKFDKFYFDLQIFTIGGD